jgi:hypothetical protein
MSQTTKRYILQFDYTDNGHLYEELLLLTDDEVNQLNSALVVLFESGYIRAVDGDPTSASLLSEYVEPAFQTLTQLKQEWKDEYLGDQLLDEGFEWQETA